MDSVIDACRLLDLISSKNIQGLRMANVIIYGQIKYRLMHQPIYEYIDQ